MGSKKIGIDLFNEVNMISHLACKNGKYYFIGKTGNAKTNTYDSNLFTLRDDGTARKLTSTNDVKDFFLMDEGIVFASMRKPEDKTTAGSGRPLTVYQILPFDGGEAEEYLRIPYIVEQIIPAGNGTYFFKALYDHTLMDLLKANDDNWEKTLAERKEQYESCTVFDEMPFWFNGAGYINKLRHVLCYFDGKDVSILTDTFSSVGKLVLSDDGTKLLYSNKVYKTRMPFRDELYVMDTQTKEATQINSTFPCQVRGYAFISNDHVCALANIEMDNKPDFECPQMIDIDVKTGTYTTMIEKGTYNFGISVGSDLKLGSAGVGLRVSENKVYFANTDTNDVHLYEYDLTASKLYQITKEPGLVAEAVSCDDGYITMSMRGNDLVEIYHLDADGTEKRISHVNDAVMGAYALSTPELISFTNKEGSSIYGWIMKPIDIEDGKTYPCILDIHGGPRTAYGSVFFHEMQYWCAQGYVVIFCNPTGSEGRGDSFAAINGHWGSIDYEDIMQFVEEACVAAPFIDAKRIGVTGGSYGGYMTNWIIGHTDRFLCAASQRSISNFISFTNYGDISCPFTDNVVGGETAWTNVDALWNVSPLKYADRCVTPTLFIHSEQDYRCNVPEGVQMMYGLMRRGIETRMCLFKGENHELSRSGKPKNRIRRLDEITKWMDSHLK